MSESAAHPQTYTARWVFPVDRPPLEGGTVTVAGGRIASVEPRGARRADVDLGNVALLPGLVNAHTHLDLSGARGHCPPGPDFTAWLLDVIAFRRARTAEQVREDVRAGLEEAIKFGTTLLGDVAAEGATWDALAAAPLRAVVFRELIGLSDERAAAAWGALVAWLLSRPASATCRPGISPHAPYSARASLFFAAACEGVPVMTHLAETAAERRLLLDRQGPFVGFLKGLGAWAPDGLADSPDHVLRLTSSLSPVLYAHGNDLRPDEAVPANGTVVFCPRTHAAFGHPPHPFRELLARGARVALGTDSLASNPDLDVLAEARFLHGRHPEVPGSVLLRMATLSGAEALGWGGETGSLTPGKSADLVALPLPEEDGGDPHRLVLGGRAAVRGVLFRGGWVRGGLELAPRES
jgi:cytosine/adenosine deaminase-related metal-dependent hydrolase